jgi:4-amino-4-deoxy-L-arabinose transferase-like glycosyltransferase
MYLGKSEALLRLPPAIFGIGTIIVTYYLGKTLFDRKTGLIGALFVSISPFLIYYSQEARAYSQLAFLATASLLFLMLSLKKASFIRYLAYFILTILCLYTHIFAACLLVGQNIYMLLLWKREKVKLKPWIITQALLLFCYIPAIMFILKTIQHHATASYSIAKTIAGISYVFIFGRLLLPINLNFIIVIIGAAVITICSLISLKELWEDKNNVSLFFFSYVITFVFALIANYRFHAFNHEDARYLIFLSPLFYLLIARGACRIPYPKLKNYTIILIIIICAASLYPYFFKWNSLGKGNFRQAAEFIKTQELGADDLILCSDYRTRKIMRYYLKHHLAFELIGDKQSQLDHQHSHQKIIFVGFSDRTALDFIRSNGAEIDPWTGAVFHDQLVQNGYMQSDKAGWPGKNRIDVFVYVKSERWKNQ